MRVRNRLLRLAALALFASAGLLPSSAGAAQDNPDFYATIVAVSPDHRTITVSPTKDQLIVVDVSQLGSQPFDVGAFAVNNVILLRTMRVGDRLVATGWDQARNGSQDTAFEGVEQKPPEKEKEEKEERVRERR
jgi:hypothetical protein